MTMNVSLPEKHRQFLTPFLRAVEKDNRIIGVAAIGSLAFGDIDEYSDLDLIIVCEDAHRDELLKNAEAFAQRFGPLLTCYGGQHVGEPRLAVCLYGEPLLHVDLTFMTLDEFSVDRVQVPTILLDREGLLASAVAGIKVEFPKPDRQMIETKFWVWIFNAASKLARGDLFSTLSYIAMIRRSALVPLIQDNGKVKPRGYRTLHKEQPIWFERLVHTHPKQLNRQEIIRALRSVIEIYRAIRVEGKSEEIVVNSKPEQAVVKFLDSIENSLAET